MRNLGFWLIILGVVLAVVFVVGKFLFPELISRFTALIVGLLVAVTGLFLRRKKASN